MTNLAVELIGLIPALYARCPISVEEKLLEKKGIFPRSAFTEDKYWEIYIESYAKKHGESSQISRLFGHVARKFPDASFDNVLGEAILQYYFYKAIRAGVGKRIR